MTAADAEHRRIRRVNEIAETGEQLRLVIIKVAQRTAEHDGVRLEFGDGLGQPANVSYFCNRLLNQSFNVRDDILQRQRSNLALALQLWLCIFAQLSARDVREVILVAQQVVHDQYTLGFDRLLDRFVAAKVLLIEGEG